jgi:hypothetical protein
MVEIIKVPEFEEYLETHGVLNYRPWSELEEQILEEYYGIIPPALLSEKLGRSIKAIRDKANVMGIKAEDNQKKRINP